MKKLMALALIPLMISSHSFARDTVQSYSIDEALSVEKIKSSLGSDIKFYFGDQPHPSVVENFGEFKTNKKTNAFGKSDKKACQWVFLSALLALKQRAIKEGGNAVINIKSNYKGNLSSSNDSFKCGAGAVMAGAALVGDVVKIQE
ncbi:hypothetical protein [Simiduia aestuariiviva]|uniref:Excinuclease ATPase subunit n=1 Tax=Simiduia aestuariiviva TaxID=1510459 RepID=A0A839UQ12_9GAMM|nr:hypothetical protein [Simiduia aestuariiviva]MBB3168590.1 hypothetical protein [Simiduia aestuariiviva]